MILGVPGRPREKLGVISMAVALVLAAFLGAALGLIWQGSSFLRGEEDEHVTTQGSDDEGAADSDADEPANIPATG